MEKSKIKEANNKERETIKIASIIKNKFSTAKCYHYTRDTVKHLSQIRFICICSGVARAEKISNTHTHTHFWQE